MKQAEHPPVTAGANSAAEYSLAIIDQLARIDRTCSKEEMDELVYRLLAFVGGHLGSARENLRMLTLLGEKQKSLEQNLQAVKLEQQMLKVLCKDSTSVYRVDLMNDRAEIVKIEEHSNSAGDLLPHGQELFSYAEAVEHYYHKCVLKESVPDFLQFLDAESLMRELRTKDRVSRRYRSVPNAIGNIYFEVRANRVQQTETSFQILLDFRSVDEIVKEEREHQHALETALTESRMSYEVISAISKIYYTIYRIDLRTGYYEEVASERQMHRLTGHSGRAIVHMSEMSKQSTVPEYLPYVEPFFDLSTLAERLWHEDSVMLEYPVRDGNWHLARFIVQTRGKNGEAEQVLFAMRLYSEEKRREKDLMSAADAARRANGAKSEFLSRMSHDIRTPMNVIMGFTNIALQHADDSDKMKECLEKIRVSGSNLQELIDDVPDISRIESGEFKIVSQPVKLPELFDFYCQTIAGIGMTPEFMEQMYSAFSRAVDTRVNKVRGSGLGLAIVKKIVDLMGGAIEAESKVGKGTTFRVTLDLPAAADDAETEEHTETAITLPEKPLTVLVAEDNDLNYEITAEQLRGYRVHCVRAVNGQDCLQRIEQAAPDEFDAILMDMQMPVMNGLKATAAIRKLDSETAKHIPIIALTANAYHEDIQKCLAAGMNAHLSKPINIDRAVRTIQRRKRICG